MNERKPGRYSAHPKADLVAALDELHGIRNAVHHEMLLITAELERREAHVEDGQRDIGSWLQLRLGVSRRTAQRWREASEKVEDLPCLSEAFASGRISFDKLAACTGYATPETDRMVADEAQRLDASLCERTARRRRDVSRSDEDRIARTKRLTFSWAEMGTRLDIWGSLSAEEGAAVVAAIERIADSLPLRDAEGELTSVPTRQADALVMLARRTIAEDQDPDRATVNIHVPLEAIASRNGIGEAEVGGVFSSDVMRRLVCDSRVQAVIENADGEAVGISTVLRTAPAHIRRQLQHRDGGTCRFPGCTNRYFVDAHHVQWWTEGGTTELTNLVLLCRWHHRLVHEKGWRIEGDPHGSLSFIRPDGTILDERPSAITSATQEWLWDGLLEERFGSSEEKRGPPVLV